MPYNYITDTGTIVFDSSTLLAGVQAEYVTAFGASINLAPFTPQGLLINGEVISRTAAGNNNAQLGNQINPNLAGGVFLDAILALLGSARNNNTYTTTIVNLAGVPGSIVPINSVIQDAVTGFQFQLNSSVTLTGGVGSTIAQALLPGPTPAEAGNLTQIITPSIGWETVTNPGGPTFIGTVTQSDESAKNFRLNTLAVQASSFAEAMTTVLYLTPGVTSVKIQENDATTTQVINGVTMPGKSFYACVAGGTDTAVAAAMVSKKPPGTAYSNGAGIPSSVSYTVPFSGQVMTILFDRPTQIGILIQVTATADSSIQDPVNIIKNAILTYVVGGIAGLSGFQIGTPVSTWEIAMAIGILAPGVFVTNLEITVASLVDYSPETIPIEIFQQAFTNETNISVVLA